MKGTNSCEAALARWLAQGATSQTHRFLRRVFDDFFRPLGIEAEALEAEPFSALESGQGEWWLRRPHWKPENFDRTHRTEPDFRFLLDMPERFAVAVDPRGGLDIELRPPFVDDPAASAALRENEEGWRAARHALEAADGAEAFMLAAAALLLANDAAAALYAAGDDDGFCEAVRSRWEDARRT